MNARSNAYCCLTSQQMMNAMKQKYLGDDIKQARENALKGVQVKVKHLRQDNKYRIKDKTQIESLKETLSDLKYFKLF